MEQKRTRSYTLYHGTTREFKKQILEEGFRDSTAQSSWCGNGVYFYDIKDKAWWAANRKASEIGKKQQCKVQSAVITVGIENLNSECICDLRDPKQMHNLQELANNLMSDEGDKLSILNGDSPLNDDEQLIILRSMLIGFYAQEQGFKLVIGNFEQRDREEYKAIKEFASKIKMMTCVELIYCVKDKSVISKME